MIDVKKVLEKKDLIDFVKFPFKLYKESKYWVPPIIDQEINNFNKDLNPYLKNSEVELFIAIKDNEIAGRIAVIINWFEVKQQKTSKIRFGWFDFIDDLEVYRQTGSHVDSLYLSQKIKLFLSFSIMQEL